MGVEEHLNVLKRFQKAGEPELSVKGLLERMATAHGIPADVGMVAIEIILTQVAQGRQVADRSELGSLILKQAKGIMADQLEAAGKVVSDRINAVAQWLNREAIGDAYAVADEAAGLLAAKQAASPLVLERKLFLEAPPWARLWWAFRGRLGPK